jgi:hypothetical protein
MSDENIAFRQTTESIQYLMISVEKIEHSITIVNIDNSQDKFLEGILTVFDHVPLICMHINMNSSQTFAVFRPSVAMISWHINIYIYIYT